MKKILFLTKYSRKGASSRMRSYQYFPYLETAGYKITAAPLFDDLYLEQLYSGNFKKLNIIKYYLKRFIILFGIFKYEKVVIEYELFPYLPSWGEWILSKLGVDYIVDYDDAIFHNYDMNKNEIIRFLLKSKIDHVMKYSGSVVVGNSYLYKRAKVSGANSIYTIPTVVDLNKYSEKDIFDESKFVIGWIGSPSTYKYIHLIEPLLKDFSQNRNVVIRIIGAYTEERIEGNFHYMPWVSDEENSMIKGFDVGIMPLTDDPWSRGKCSFKLIQYMASGLPVIGNPIGMNNDVIEDGKNGFAVNTDLDWLNALTILYDNMYLQKVYGKRSREIVEEQYCLQEMHKKWMLILNNDLKIKKI